LLFFDNALVRNDSAKYIYKKIFYSIKFNFKRKTYSGGMQVMNKKDKKRLIYEAEKQTQEVKNLKRWIRKSIGLSSITMIIAYFGIKSSGLLTTFGIIGIVLTIIFVIAAIFINMGIKNGQKNIKKILSIVEGI
jgi:hypothetical protein